MIRKQLRETTICLALIVGINCAACTGALAGGVVSVGQDNHLEGVKLYTANCAPCHAPMRNRPKTFVIHKSYTDVEVPVFAGPDLLSTAWKVEMARVSYRPDEQIKDWKGFGDTIEEIRRAMDAGYMHTIFSNATWYGRERTLDGKRPTYDTKRRTTLDGLPIFVAKEETVTVMPSFMGYLDIEPIRDWITCHHYPSSQYCR